MYEWRAKKLLLISAGKSFGGGILKCHWKVVMDQKVVICTLTMIIYHDHTLTIIIHKNNCNCN